MKVYRAMGCAVAALGLSLLASGAASAEESWPRYAPRCQPAELARDVASRDPCEAPLATFGLSGPTVLSRNEGIDVQATGSINGETRGARSDARSKL